MKLSIRILLPMTLALLLNGPLSAGTTEEFVFEGRVTSTTLGGVNPGDLITATLSYDLCQQPARSVPTSKDYDDYSFSLQVGVHSFSESPTSTLRVANGSEFRATGVGSGFAGFSLKYGGPTFASNNLPKALSTAGLTFNFVGVAGSPAVPVVGYITSITNTVDASCNEPPQAICQDVEVPASAICSADASIDFGSSDPDGDSITLSQAPPGPYPLGETDVVLTVNDGELESTCQGTVTVVDGASPVIACNAPTTITPPDAPISFTATASDNCSVSSVVIEEYDCYKYTKKRKRIDKTGSCQVSLDGDTVTILDSGGVGTFITWKVRGQDGSGNAPVMNCTVEVDNPGQGN